MVGELKVVGRWEWCCWIRIDEIYKIGSMVYINVELYTAEFHSFGLGIGGGYLNMWMVSQPRVWIGSGWYDLGLG